jgi:tellurium resistance protein TerD
MTINLQKGQRISLKKEAPNLTKVMLGLGWDVNSSKGGLFGMFSQNFDLDSSVLCLNSQDKIGRNDNVIYFGQLRHYSGAIVHQGDNLTGAGAGDDEQIMVDLPKVPSVIHRLVFVVNIYNCLERKQDFSQVKNAFVRLVDMSNNKEIARYHLSGSEYQGQTSMIMAEVYRDNDEWKMEAIGKGIRVNGLQQLIQLYS